MIADIILLFEEAELSGIVPSGLFGEQQAENIVVLGSLFVRAQEQAYAADLVKFLATRGIETYYQVTQ